MVVADVEQAEQGQPEHAVMGHEHGPRRRAGDGGSRVSGHRVAVEDRARLHTDCSQHSVEAAADTRRRRLE
jgi:hypothetical protein